MAEIDGLPEEDDVPDQLHDKERSALFEVATLPCADDELFLEKLRYLVSNQKRAYGPTWHGEKVREIMIALELHMLDGITE